MDGPHAFFLYCPTILRAVGRGIVGPSPIKIMARGPIRAGRASPVPLYASLLGPLG